MKNNKNNKAFSLIEVIISIFVFTLWVMSVYAIIVSTTQVNDYNKNYIIASNLAREQLELIRNIRDTNYKNIQNYNQIDPNLDFTSTNYSSDKFFETGSHYKIENNFSSSSSDFWVKVEKINPFEEWKDKLIWTIMWNYKLCLDSNNLYAYCNNITWTKKETIFYKYIYIDEVKYNDWTNKTIDNAIKITSKVIWNSKGYHSTEINTILADWKRL